MGEGRHAMTAPRVVTGRCAICWVWGAAIETHRDVMPARRTCLACVQVCVDMAHDKLAGAMLAADERVREAA